MMMNKKADISISMIFIIIFFFVMAVANILSITMWNSYNNIIQSQPDSVIDSDVKEKMDSLGVFFTWADDLFAFTYFLLMIVFLISARTASKAQPEFIIIFIALLVVITVFCMVISNTWLYISQQSSLSSATAEVTYTDFILTYYPIITVIILVLGAIIYYNRKEDVGLGLGGGGGGFLDDNSFVSGGRGDNFE